MNSHFECRHLLGLIASFLAITTALADEHSQSIPFRVPDGFETSTAAKTPLVSYPMFAVFDTAGRLYVSESAGLDENPKQRPLEPPHRIVMLEDLDNDGSFDKRTIFAEGLTYPEGLGWYRGALYVASPPDLLRLRDSDDDGRADKREVILTGFKLTGIADDMHGPQFGPDGLLYVYRGRHYRTDIRQPEGPVLLSMRSPAILRCSPDGSNLEIFSQSMGNTVEAVFTPAGEILTAGTYYAPPKMGDDLRDAIIHNVYGGLYPIRDLGTWELPRTGDLLPPVSHLGWASASGFMRARGRGLGNDMHGSYFTAQYAKGKVQRHAIIRQGSTFIAENHEFAIPGKHPFYPTDVLEDADGSLLIVDTGGWYTKCSKTDSDEDLTGGIYRIRRTGVKPTEDPWGTNLAWNSISTHQLVERFDDSRFAVRDRAVDQVALRGLEALNALERAITKENSRVRRNAAWALCRIPGEDASRLLRELLDDDDNEVRQAAVHSVGIRRDTEAIEQLLEILDKDIPPVQREAATAIGLIGDSAASTPLLESLPFVTDRFVEHAVIYALIELRNEESLLDGMRHENAFIKRGSLIALDQTHSERLTADLVAIMLDEADVELRTAALDIVMRRQWSAQIIETLGALIESRERNVERDRALRGIIAAFHRDPEVQSIITKCMLDDRASQAMKLVILEALIRYADHLSDDVVDSMRVLLESPHTEESLAEGVVRTVIALDIAELDEQLKRLAEDTKRSTPFRVTAIRAFSARASTMDDEIFSLLLSQFEHRHEPLERLDAARALGDAQLTIEQQRRLINILNRCGPLELPLLLSTFARSNNEDTLLLLFATLNHVNGLTSACESQLRGMLENKPPAVQEAAKPVIDRLNPNAKLQRERMAELESHLSSGDAQRGEEIFFSTMVNCVVCHRIGDRGGDIGPNLSTIAQKLQQPRDLLEAVVLPNAGIARGYETLRIRANDDLFLGVIMDETSDSIFLRDASGNTMRVDRASIQSIKSSPVSLMPSGFDQALTTEQLADLIAFLNQQR